MGQPHFSHLRAYAESLTSQFEDLRRGLGDFQRDLSAITATAKSPDGYVKATVGFRGQLVALELDPRIYRHPDSKLLAASITETVGRATADAAGKVDDLSSRFEGDLDIKSILDGALPDQLSRFDFVMDEVTRRSE